MESFPFFLIEDWDAFLFSAIFNIEIHQKQTDFQRGFHTLKSIKPSKSAFKILLIKIIFGKIS